MWLTWNNLKTKDSFQRKHRMVHLKQKGTHDFCVFLSKKVILRGTTSKKVKHFCFDCFVWLALNSGELG